MKRTLQNKTNDSRIWVWLLILVAVFTFGIASSKAQNINRVEYFFDTDPGFGLGTSITITPSANVTNISSNIPLNSLVTGFHTFYIRARDVNGKWSITHNRAFYKENSGASALLANVNKAEYFFDTDPGFGLGINIPITASNNVGNITLNAPVTSLSAGFHTFYIRARDANGKWSVTHNRVFYKENLSQNAPLVNVNKAEYFFNTDPGFGAGINIPITAGINVGNILLAAPLTSLPIGFHTFYIRVRDANGKWSVTHNRVFYKENLSQNAPLAIINKAEYFFDTDPGFGAGINIPITAGINVSNIALIAPLTTLATGFHSFYIRVRDVNGKWSITHNRAFYKESLSQNSPLATINKAEYFFDTDPGFGLATNIALTPSSNITNLDFIADVSSLSIGLHKVYSRVRDANGKWSIVSLKEFEVTSPSPPVLTTGTIVGSPFCAGSSVSVPFTVNQTFGLGNTFTAQLSDASGVFPATPIAIGTLISSISGTINATIPLNISTGSGYRIRVVSSNPVINGITNTSNIVLNALPNVSLANFAPVSINTPVFFLSGGLPLGGTYSGTGVTANSFDPSIAGLGTFNLTYTVTTVAGCVKSETRSIIVNPIINAPSSLTATAVSTSQINLAWVNNATNSTSISIESSGNPSGPFTLLVSLGSNSVTSFNNTSLSASTTRFYRVSTNNNTGGVSAFSNIANATTFSNAGTQTIMFNAPSNPTFGNSPISLSASASSGLPVSFSLISGGSFASLSGANNGLLTIIGAGTIVVRASQAGNGSFLPAPNVDQTIVLQKANPIITWNNPLAITFPTPISATQLNATANVSGSFVYNPLTGTVLNAGSQSLGTTFTPTDLANFNVVTSSVSIFVNKANPVLTFANPADIIFPTALSGTQLNATANVAGTFTYNPSSGAILPAGNAQVLTANFVPTSSNFNNASITALINVLKGNPLITWANPANITIGTALSGTQLNAVANVTGSFVYNPIVGTVLSAGNGQNLNTTFTPNDAANYNQATAIVQINVNNLQTPIITWANPVAITFGTALSATQLNATANTAGTFSYNPVAGTILNAGTQTLNVQFNPTNTAQFAPASASVQLLVNKANPVLTFANPADIIFPTALSGTQLNATANVAGTFTYNPSSGAVLPAGNAQVLTANFVPTSSNFNNASITALINVLKGNPIITWANPANITIGTALSGTQLNAVANVTGSFVYNPIVGTVLPAGNGQNLNTTFTPNDASNYNQATASVQINVNNLQTPIITWANPAPITFGTALSATQLNATANTAGTFTYNPVTGTILNAGTQTLNVQFNPTNTAQFAPANASVQIVVNKANPVLTFANPVNIIFPTALSGTQLNATANVAGTFTYNPLSGAVLPAGNAQVLTANFVPTSSNFNNASITALINVLKGNPLITWANPANITVGTALSGTQLNAVANVTGSFVYNPIVGTVLPAGNGQNLNTTFTPNDAANYNQATASVQINVVTVIPGNCSASGSILYEFWSGVSGNTIADIPVLILPSFTLSRGSFEGYTNSADNYASRFRGYVCAPQTGNYLFYIASNEQGVLFLSTDDNPANKIQIASVNGFTNSRQWNKFPSQQSVLIPLIAGQRYYIEALQKESNGSDNLAVGWRLPDNSFERPILGNRLSPFDPGINIPPTVIVTLPNNNSFYGIGAVIPVTAIAKDLYGTVQQVELFVNGVSNSIDVRSPYQFTLNGLASGIYTLTAVATDDDGMMTTSAPIVIEVSAPISAECLATGTIEREVWNSVTGTNIFQIPLNTSPNAVSILTSFEGPTNAGDNYGARIRGFICPPQTGDYSFYLSSDDKSELWLSPDSTSANAVKIANVNSFTNFRQWNKFPNQKSGLINLLAGKKYYIHALHKEGLQFDHISVGWDLPGGVQNRPISGQYLSPFILQTNTKTLLSTINSNYTDNWLKLNVFPNPFSTTTRIEWTSTKSGATQILLFDLNGRVVRKIYEGNVDENQPYFYNLEAENLDAGIYMLKVLSNENLYQLKIVFTK